jgi:hypothetical protein
MNKISIFCFLAVFLTSCGSSSNISGVSRKEKNRSPTSSQYSESNGDAVVAPPPANSPPPIPEDEKATQPTLITGGFLTECSWVGENTEDNNGIAGCRIQHNGQYLNDSQVIVNKVSLVSQNETLEIAANMVKQSDYPIQFQFVRSLYGQELSVNFVAKISLTGTSPWIQLSEFKGIRIVKIPEFTDQKVVTTPTNPVVSEPVSPPTPPKPSGGVNLKGRYNATGFMCVNPTPINDSIDIVQTGNKISGVRQKGDACFSAGSKTFDGVIQSDEKSIIFTMYDLSGTPYNNIRGTLSDTNITIDGYLGNFLDIIITLK